MSPVLVVETPSRRVLYPLLAPGRRSWLAGAVEQQGLTIDVDESESPASFVVSGPDGARTVYCRWFAWYSQHPRTALEELAPPIRPAAR